MRVKEAKYHPLISNTVCFEAVCFADTRNGTKDVILNKKTGYKKLNQGRYFEQKQDTGNEIKDVILNKKKTNKRKS